MAEDALAARPGKPTATPPGAFESNGPEAVRGGSPGGSSGSTMAASSIATGGGGNKPAAELVRAQHEDDGDDTGGASAPAAASTSRTSIAPAASSRTRRLYARMRTRTGRMPRQWLYDRCDGTSKSGMNYDAENFDDDHADEEAYWKRNRPPNRACWPPFLLKWYPDLLEQNCPCETVGRFGCVDPTDKRRRRALLGTCLAANVVGFIFLILASLAIADQSDSFSILWYFPFTQVWLEEIGDGGAAGSGAAPLQTPSIFGVGLKAVAWRQTVLGNNDTVIPFDAFCAIENPGQPRYSTALNATIQALDERVKASARSYMTLFVETTSTSNSHGCGACQEMSQGIVPSLFLSMLGYIPNFTTDVLRMYENYDVNCQKFLASIFSWISLSTAIYTWANYHINCFAYLDHAPIALNENLEPVPISYAFGGSSNNNSTDQYQDEEFQVVQFRYRAGLGEVCLALATLLKIVDIVCNVILPTPSITRDHEEQVEYEWRYGPGANGVGGCDVGGSSSPGGTNASSGTAGTATASGAGGADCA